MGEKYSYEKKYCKKKDIPAVWFSLKKSLHCKSHPSDVHHPTTTTGNQLSVILARKPAGTRSGCSRSIANLKDVVIHGTSSKRHLQEQQELPNSSPRSIGSSDFLNPITHHVVFTKSHLKITTSPAPPHHPKLGFQNSSPISSRRSSPPPTYYSSSSSFGCNNVMCKKCGSTFPKLEALQNHHFSTHSVTDLVHGDSSRKIVEIICKSSLAAIKIHRVLKIHNSPKILSRFEAYRESVKLRASKLPKKHPRCLADGNELLRFHGASLTCALPAGGGVCDGRRCSVCRIIRGEIGIEDGVGVLTASTSGRAYEMIGGIEKVGGKKAVVVCRVIAGRVHRPVAAVEEVRLTGFDSLAGKLGIYSNIEELYLLNPYALLPCFLVICNS